MAAFQALFTEKQQLCKDLKTSNGVVVDNGGGNDTPSLPGQPMLAFNNPTLPAFLMKDLLTPDLDRMAPHLWLVATQSHTHVSALHHQLVRGRNIFVTENPQLHLVWINDRVFIKPIPKYLMSHAFWDVYLPGTNTTPLRMGESARLADAARGFLRSWYYLVRHESDFIIAKEKHLIPQGIEWTEFAIFISNFASVSNHQVSPRYQFGDLRLSRLNLWAKVFLRRWYFYKLRGQYWAYFAQFYGPLLFLFAVLTIILSAMQVVLSSNRAWSAFTSTSIWFSVVTLVLIVVVVMGLLLLLVGMIVNETIYALRDRYKKKRR